MIWQYADRYGELAEPDAMKAEALVKIAEQLEQLNKHLAEIKQNLKPLKISGGINTHPY